jgi:hypothetical protein
MVLKGHKDGVTALACLPDGMLVSADNRRLIFWD